MVIECVNIFPQTTANNNFKYSSYNTYIHEQPSGFFHPNKSKQNHSQKDVSLGKDQEIMYIFAS
jgi:hypothetical protein